MLPDINEHSIAEMEANLRLLTHQLAYMKELLAIKRKYGME